MHKLGFDTLASPIFEVFFEIRNFFQKPILGDLGVLILPASLRSSTLKLPKIVYICQDAYPKKLQGCIFVQISLILSVKSINSELLAITEMKNILKTVKWIP